MPDLLFDQILDELQEIHEVFPELSFGAVIQQAIDSHKLSFNKNLNDVSSKEIMAALQSFNGKHTRVRLNQSVNKEIRLQRALDAEKMRKVRP